MLIVICAFVLALVFCAITSKLAPSLSLLAEVGEHRQHEKSTPVVGGMAMFFAIAFVLGYLVIFSPDSLSVFTTTSTTVFAENHFIAHYLLGASLLVFVGVLDDRFHLPFLLRLIVQVIAVMIMVHQGNVLYSLGELFSKDTLLLGRFSIPLTVFATVGVINALNMMDGIDGLAGSLCLISFMMLMSFPFEQGYINLMLAWSGALCAFLLFNCRIKKAARLFMGDAGSTVLGYTLAWLLIYGTQQMLENVPSPRYFPPIFAVWLLALPLFETVSLMLLRVLERKSPFYADRGHMHHHLLEYTQSVNLTVFLLLVWFGAYALLGFIFNTIGIAAHIQTMVFAILFITHIIIQANLRRKNLS